MKTTPSAINFSRAVHAEASMLHQVMIDELQCIDLAGADQEQKTAVEHLYGIAAALDNLAAQAVAYAEYADQMNLEECKKNNA